MNATLERTVQNLPLEEKFELLSLLHDQVAEALNLQLPIPESVELELHHRIARMRLEPHVGIPWREVLKP
jgi:dihydroneopterin aldolase